MSLYYLLIEIVKHIITMYVVYLLTLKYYSTLINFDRSKLIINNIIKKK